jgi:hypothetical protein
MKGSELLRAQLDSPPARAGLLLGETSVEVRLGQEVVWGRVLPSRLLLLQRTNHWILPSRVARLSLRESHVDAYDG